MKVRSVLVIVALVSIVASIAACGGTPPSSTSSSAPKVSTEAQKYASLKGDATKGKDRYLSTCSACHGPEAKGLPSLGKDLTTSEFSKGLSDPEMILFVVKGRAANDPANTTKVDMPPKGGNPALSDQDLADIVRFVKTLQK